MNTPRGDRDRTPVWQPDLEPRLTGIVLPSFEEHDDPDHLDDVERDRRSRAAREEAAHPHTRPAGEDLAGAGTDPAALSMPLAPLVPLVPAGPPPAWPPPEPAAHRDRLEAPLPAAQPALAGQSRRDFPRYIHGELVLPAEAIPAPETIASALNPPTVNPATVNPAALQPAALQPTAVNPTASHPTAVNPAASHPTAVHPAAVNPVTAPPATWTPQPAEPQFEEAATAHPPTAQPPTAQPGPRRPGPRDGSPHPAFPESTARTFRILPIAADLMPLEITETRRVRRLRRLVFSGVAVVAALVVAWYGLAVREHTQAEARLQSVLDTKQDLTRQKHQKYDELTKIQSDSKKIDDRLQKLLERDLSWSRLLASLRRTADAKHVKITGVTGALDQGAAAATARNASGNTIGTLTLTGTAPSKSDVAAYADALATVPGIANPFPTDATEGDDGVSFTIRMDVTRAALGGRFTSPSASTSGGK